MAEMLSETKAPTVGDWLDQIKLAEKDKYYSGWLKRCDKIIKRYRDERAISNTVLDKKGKKSFNIFYSNVQTLAPAIYSRVPAPQVERRFRDSDPVARAAAHILERALDFTIQDYDFDQTLTNCRNDYLLTGRGQAWVRYVPEYGPLLDEMGQQVIGEDGQPMQRLAYERVKCEYVHWKDFLHNPARVWEEVTWVARKVYLTKEELSELAGPDVAEQVSMNYAPEGAQEKDGDAESRSEKYKKAVVYEVWDKTTKTVYWLTKGFSSGFLKTMPDPLGLEHFFPCPKPMLGILTADTVIPIPDFSMYQDQAAELDDIATRKALLLKAIRVVGIYDPSKQELARLLDEASENEMVPANDWAGFAASGGIKGAVDFLPLTEAIQTLMQLNDAEQRVKQEIYEITGIADIIRGNSSPSETATAQQIKGQFATLRISDRQRAFQRFARDIVGIKGEIIAEHFQPETLAAMVGAQNLPLDEQQSFMQALELLRNQMLRSYRIDIETDSTISVDEQLDKQAATEFLSAVGPFMQQSIQVMQTSPSWGPVMGQMLTFVTRRYKAGRNFEGAIEQAVQQTLEQVQQQQEAQAQAAEQPDPEMQKLEAQMQLEQQKLQLESAKVQNDISLKQAQAQADMQIQQLKQQLEMSTAQWKAALEQEKLRGTMELQAAKVQADMYLKASMAQDSDNEATLEDLAPPAPQPMPAIPPIIVNVDAKAPAKKIGTITRTPDGNSIVTVEDAPA